MSTRKPRQYKKIGGTTSESVVPVEVPWPKIVNADMEKKSHTDQLAMEAGDTCHWFLSICEDDAFIQYTGPNPQIDFPCEFTGMISTGKLLIYM